MTKYVSDTNAGKAISAYIVLDKRGKLVGKILAHHGDSCMVNVFDWGKTQAQTDTFQRGTAGGYGYDKFTAALNGKIIDGHRLTDHGASDPACKTWLKRYWATIGYGERKVIEAKARAKGYTFANYKYKNWDTGEELPENERGYTDCFPIAGIDGLRAKGYQVIQAI